MTSANRSSEPIAYEDDDAFERLHGLADAFLTGERPIARRMDDSVARAGVLGPVILRRARGYAPGAAARLPVSRPVLAVGADLKNTVTLVVGGEAFVSQHIGDLRYYEALRAFRETIQDLLEMYEVDVEELRRRARPPSPIRLHPARLELPARETVAVQHHRAHVASVLAERGAFDRQGPGRGFRRHGIRRRRRDLGRRILRGLAPGRLRARGPPAGGRAPWGRRRGRESGPGGRGLSRRAGGDSGPDPAAVLFPGALPPGDGADRQRAPHLSDHLRGTAVRHRGGPAGLHPRDHLRGPGRALAGAARPRRAARRLRFPSPSRPASSTSGHCSKPSSRSAAGTGTARRSPAPSTAAWRRGSIKRS